MKQLQRIDSLKQVFDPNPNLQELMHHLGEFKQEVEKKLPQVKMRDDIVIDISKLTITIHIEEAANIDLDIELETQVNQFQRNTKNLRICSTVFTANSKKRLFVLVPNLTNFLGS